MHPAVADDPIALPRHRSFLAGCLASGSLALLVLPLYLAFFGATNLPAALALAWMLAQLPLALYLSQTGDLERAHAGSAALFASFLTGICLLTGGIQSFALIWLTIVPLEAALSGSRKVIIGATVGCAAIALALVVFPSADAAYEVAGGSGLMISTIAACLYMSILAYRVAVDQARSRKHLEETVARQRLFNGTIASVTCTLSDDGTTDVIGGSLEKLLGLSPRAARGDWLFQRLHVMDRPLYLTGLSDVREDGVTRRVELRLRHGAAQPGEAGLADYVWTALTIRPANSQGMGDGMAEGTLCLTLEDITTSRARDEELQTAFRDAQEASLEKTRFIASASHELRTPLNAIIGFSNMLRTAPAEGTSGPVGREYADLIHRSSLHLLQVVDEILDSSRLETGSVKLAIEPVDLGDLVGSCAAMLTPEAEAKGVCLFLPALSGLPALAADKRAMRQILINLVSNGIKFSPEGGKVVLGIRRDGAEVVVSVCDEGEGIARDQIQRIGQPFARLQAGGGTSTPGCGLGLSIVKGLVALHGGRLKVESRQGKGTLAEVFLPAASRKAANPGQALNEQAGDNPAENRKSA